MSSTLDDTSTPARQADFYLLQSTHLQAKWQFACRLLDKIYTEKHLRVLVVCDDQSNAEQLDKLLWTYHDLAFLPHALATEEDFNDSPIVLSSAHDGRRLEDHFDVLLNTGMELLENFDNFARVVEIISNNEQDKALARERFRTYRKHGFKLESHSIKV